MTSKLIVKDTCKDVLTGNAYRWKSNVKLDFCTATFAILLSCTAAAEETNPNIGSEEYGWTVVDVDECITAMELGEFVDFDDEFDAVAFEYRVNGEPKFAICSAARYRFLYNNLQYDLLSVTGSLSGEGVLQDALRESGVHRQMQDRCRMLARNETAVCDYKGFVQNSTQLATDLDEVIDHIVQMALQQ